MILKEGSADIFAESDIRRNVISGGVKPVFKNIESASADNTLCHRLRA